MSEVMHTTARELVAGWDEKQLAGQVIVGRYHGTDPAKAAPGTIRADFARSIDENAVHGSDSLDNAAAEIAYFFPVTDLCPRTR